MTCQQLGGACNKQFRGSSFEEIIELSQQHGMEMFRNGDEVHIQAMQAVREKMQGGTMQEWVENKRKEFDALAEDEE